MISIIILNWNGWKDTVECIRSIMSLKTADFFVVIGDNGSTNDSILQIESFCNKKAITSYYDTIDHQEINSVKPRSVVLCNLLQNHGFAKGNNLLINYCMKFNLSNYILLNNDTEVTPDFLDVLLRFKEKNPQYHVVTPLILYYYDKDRVWNAGGKLFWGFRKYYYANKLRSTITEKDYIECSFITGCALLFSNEVLKTDGKLFTELFFFGEEDFELGLRLKKLGINQACVLNSVIYHKVGRSTKKGLEKTFIYYINRYVDLKHNLSTPSYHLWRFLNNLYLIIILKKRNHDFSTILQFIKHLNKEAKRLDDVNKDYFEHVLKIKK